MDSRSVLQVVCRFTEGCMWWGEGDGQPSVAQAAGCMGWDCSLRWRRLGKEQGFICLVGCFFLGRDDSKWQRIETSVLGVPSLR